MKRYRIGIVPLTGPLRSDSRMSFVMKKLFVKIDCSDTSIFRSGLVHRAARQLQQVGIWPGWFQACQYVGGLLREECVCIKKVRSAEHVEQHWLRVSDLCARPCADFCELATFNVCKDATEAPGVLLPDWVAGERQEWLSADGCIPAKSGQCRRRWPICVCRAGG